MRSIIRKIHGLYSVSSSLQCSDTLSSAHVVHFNATNYMHSDSVCNPMQTVLHSSATHFMHSNSSCNPSQTMFTCSALLSTLQCSYSMQCCSLLPMHNTDIPMQLCHAMTFDTTMSIATFQWNLEHSNVALLPANAHIVCSVALLTPMNNTHTPMHMSRTVTSYTVVQFNDIS